MATSTDKLVLQYVTRGEGTLRRSLHNVGDDVGDLESRWSQLSGAALASGVAITGVLTTIGVASLKSSGEMQKTRAAFEQLLGSANTGNKKIKELQDFAAKTPFSMTQLVQSSKQLLAMGFTANELVPTMRSLGSAISALGGNDEMFNRVIYNLGQIRAQGKAYATDLRQFAQAGINVAEIMKKATGKELSRSQLSAMDGEEFIANFMVGLDAKFGGMLDKMSRTLPGKLNNLGDEFTKLKIAIGDSITPDVVWAISKITGGIEKLEAIAKNNPGLLRTILLGGGVAGLGLAGGAGLTMLAFSYNEITKALGKTSKAKRLLTDVTKLDTAAESAKAVVAGKEGRAIGRVGSIADDVALSKRRLAGATAVETAAAARGASIWTRAGRAVGSGKRAVIGAGSSVGGLLARPAFGSGAASVLPQAANRYKFLGMGRYQDTLTGRFASRGTALAYNAEYAAAAGKSGGFRGLMSGVTNARLLGGAALGAGVGVQSFDDWKKAGYTTGQAAAAATTTGVAAGMLTMFVPGAAIPIALGEGLGWAVNKYVNEPMEKAAQGLISGKDQQELSSMTTAQKAAFYFNKRDKALKKGSGAEAGSFLLLANSYQRRAKKEVIAAADAAASEARDKSNQQDAWYRRINSMPDSFNQAPQASKSRNDGWTIRLPSSPADVSNRNMKFNANTPAPAYL